MASSPAPYRGSIRLYVVFSLPIVGFATVSGLLLLGCIQGLRW
ncbi:MAG TPA: hypothetical protein VML54_09700 [Candidatus Limnocylindrales bacterium]|nr:hypothetical protein [Candidatus Limnocylindrales bacterium]